MKVVQLRLHLEAAFRETQEYTLLVPPRRVKPRFTVLMLEIPALLLSELHCDIARAVYWKITAYPSFCSKNKCKNSQV